MSLNHSYIVAFWNPFPISDPNPCIGYFSSFFQRYGNIQCLDFRDNRDSRTFSLLRQADLVVIILHQSHREFCSLTCNDSPRLPNCVYLVTDYVPGGGQSLRDFTFEFRIPPSRLACVPYSPRMRESKKWPDIGPLSADFRRELVRAGQIMLRALGF